MFLVDRSHQLGVVAREAYTNLRGRPPTEEEETGLVAVLWLPAWTLLKVHYDGAEAEEDAALEAFCGAYYDLVAVA
jgi:hypothetical protein